MNVDDTLKLLRDNYKGDINSNTILLDIAKSNNKTPQDIYNLMKKSLSSKPSSGNSQVQGIEK